MMMEMKSNELAGTSAVQETKAPYCNKMKSLVEKLPELNRALTLLKKIGEGTFSSVYMAKSDEGKLFAIKHLVPTCHPTRIVKELECMRQIGGVDNVAGIHLCLRMNDCIAFIMPYQQHDQFSSYVKEMDVCETRDYMKALLTALRRVHSFDVIHRDVKPSNFLYSRKNHEYLLVDFGLAQALKVESQTSPSMAGRLSKKRKRETDENESLKLNSGRDSPTPQVKRQALQLIDSNLPSTVHEKRQHNSEKANTVKSGFISTADPAGVASDRVSWAKPSAPNPISSSAPFRRCPCEGRAQVCRICLSRRGQNSPRAGTPGFRPPEVLLKYPNQTTAVDIWSVGVILLSILSRTYPFFKSPDDITGLAEMMTLFGSEPIKKVAKKLGRNVVCSEFLPPSDLAKVCRSLSSRRRSKSADSEVSNCRRYPESAYRLLGRLLDLDPTTRATADEALSHPFLTGENECDETVNCEEIIYSM